MKCLLIQNNWNCGKSLSKYKTGKMIDDNMVNPYHIIQTTMVSRTGPTIRLGALLGAHDRIKSHSRGICSKPTRITIMATNHTSPVILVSSMLYLTLLYFTFIIYSLSNKYYIHFDILAGNVMLLVTGCINF